MAEKSGFFASVSGDRKYNMDFLATTLKSVWGNGTYNGDLVVAAASGMAVTVPTGQAWINGYYYRNDSALTLPIENADGVLNRKDIIVLRWDINTRDITMQVITGTFASNPVAPAIVRASEQYDLKLAEIYIAAGTTAITQAMITDTRLDKSVCGIVTGVISQVDTTTLYNQIQSDLANFQSINEADFTAWLASIKDVLDEETAGNLLNLINAHTADTAAHVTQAKQDKWDAGIVNTYTHTKTGTNHNLAGSGNNISFLAKFAIADGDTWTVNGTTVTATLQNGEVLPADLFKSGSWVTGIRLSDDGAKLNFKSAGGDNSSFNVFCQPTEPLTKNGVWLKTTEMLKPKKIVFDKNVWTAEQWQNPSGVTASSAVMSGGAGEIYGTDVYYFGTSASYTMTRVYHIATDTYASIQVLPSARYGSCSARIGTKIYLFGGKNASETYIKTAVVYDILADTFTSIADMPSVRLGANCSVYNGKIYIFGGRSSDSTVLKTAVVYDPVANTYASLADMPGTKTSFACETFGDNIYIFCGASTSVVYKYNPTSNAYTTEASCPLEGMAISAPVGNEIFLFLGTAGYAYNPTTKVYRSLPTIPANLATGATLSVCGNNLYALFGTSSSAQRMTLTAKSYSDNPTVVLYYLPNDATYLASLLTSKLCDYLPSYFKDAMLFKDTNLLFPELWLGNGTAWTKIREAQ